VRRRYYRQAKAHLLLNEPSQAAEVLITALRCLTLAEDKGLNDTLLLEVYGGLPDTEPALRAFCQKVFNGDTAGLMELRRRVEAHVKKVLGEEESVDSLLKE